jgi:hypothetical protein
VQECGRFDVKERNSFRGTAGSPMWSGSVKNYVDFMQVLKQTKKRKCQRNNKDGFADK